MDKSRYTGQHIHPSGPTHVELVAYETIDGAWDVFVFEPRGSCPELEGSRIDDDHIFIETIESADKLDCVASRVVQRLGAPYAIVPYFREVGTRRTIDKITSHLQKSGATGMHVQSIGEDNWQLAIRRKDFRTAREIIPPNVD